MRDKFLEFQREAEAIMARASSGDISETERDATLRQMRLTDSQRGDTWILSPAGEWFRKARGSHRWISDYPIDLIDPATLPPISEMTLPQIARAVHDCTLCPLHQTRTRSVPGEGSPQADIMLIGEGPGFNEDKQGRPFVGAAGQFLEELLGYAGYKREDVFITNIVKCRPPGNRDPESEEVIACRDYLERQIELIDPRVIVTLGRHSMARYFPGASISKIHGQAKEVGNRLVVPMFHPAAALHQPRWRSSVVEDFRKLPALVKEIEADNRDESDDSMATSNAEQLSLF